MIDVEDFRAASARLLAKLPRIEGVERKKGHATPRVEIDAGAVVVAAFAAGADEGSFYGLETGPGGRAPELEWKQFTLDPEGHLIAGDKRLRIRRMDFDDGGAEEGAKSWPEFAKARKVRTQG